MVNIATKPFASLQLALRITAFKFAPIILAAEAEAPRVLCLLHWCVSIPANARTSNVQRASVALEIGLCGAI